jgi:hypothetical protein
VAAEQAPAELEQRAQAAEAALEEALAERNRLWEELNRVKAEQRIEDHFRFMYERVVGSASWRLTRPLRTGKWLVRELPGRARRMLSSRPRS